MTGLWVSYTLAYLAFFYAFQGARDIADASLDGYLEVILLGIPSVVLLGGTIWLYEADIETDLRLPVIKWTVGMAVVFALAMNIVIFVIGTRFNTGELWLVWLFSIGFGGSAGTVTGIVNSKSNQQKRERRRSKIRAEAIERERDQFKTLNHYLRHEVLNEMQKINGYTWRLEQATDGDHADLMESLRNSTEAVVEFIQSVRTVLDASNGDPDLTPVDVESMLTDEARHLERSYESATVRVEAQEGVRVMAGELLERVFVNLVENAIEHNDGDVTVTLSVETGTEMVTVKVEDDGTGVPENRRGSLFSAPEGGDHGFGLFLTNSLVELYGGRLELESTGPEGTTFAVHLLPTETEAHPLSAATPAPAES